MRDANIEKGDDTAFDYINRKYGSDGLVQYVSTINDFFKHHGDKAKAKKKKLLMTQSDIPEDFIARDLRDTQYIAKKAKTMLEEVFRVVNTTTGSITARLREDWQLVDILQELNWDKYKALGLTYYETNKDGQKIPKIRDWTKRNDHRHHAMDALTVAFTKRNHIQYLNNLNAKSEKNGAIYGIEQKELRRDEKNKLRFKPPIPLDDFRAQAKAHLERVLVSHKAKNKVVTKNRNTINVKGGSKSRTELTPRGQLHLETIYGSIKQYKTFELKVGSGFDKELIMKVAKKKFREALLNRLVEFDNDPKKAFTAKNSLGKNPIYLDNLQTIKVPEKVKLVEEEIIYTIRKSITPDLNIEKVIDVKIRAILQKRLNEFNGNSKDAFANLDDNPIWQNKEKGIKLKRVTISGVSNAIALHSRVNEIGQEVPVDFVNTGNNHHVAIYRDNEGDLQERVVSLFEAVARINQGLNPIDKEWNRHLGWRFEFTMKQNEYFVFTNENAGFSPSKLDLTDKGKFAIISPNLFRVQKLATKDYFFRHHVETDVEDKRELKGVTWKRLGINAINDIVKVRLNHIGNIVSVGEY